MHDLPHRSSAFVITRRTLIGLAGATAVAGLAGSASASTSEPDDSNETGSPDTTTDDSIARTVDHPLGQTDVPSDATRVVALDRRSTLPHLLALGVTPVAALTHESIIGQDFPQLVDDLLDGVEVIGTGGDSADAPNLESVAAADPDLILGWSDGLADFYDRLSEIAPTVGVEIDFADPTIALRQIADVIGRSDRAEQIITEFDNKVAEAGESIGNPGDVTVLLGIGDGQFRIYVPGSLTIANWIADLGGSIGPDPATLDGEAYEDLFVTISPEQLGAITADTVILLFNTGEAGEAAVAEIEESPLWPTLPAVAAGRVIKLNSQEVSSQVGYQGLEAVLGSLVEQWSAFA